MERQLARRARRFYIPCRYILAAIITVLEAVAIIGITALLCAILPRLKSIIFLAEALCAVRIASSDENPDYKVSWLLLVLLLPVIGLVLYFTFYSRTLHPKHVRRLHRLPPQASPSHLASQAALESAPPAVRADAEMLCRISGSRPYTNTAQRYFASGEEMRQSLLFDLQAAEQFVFLEFFLIREGVFWSSVLEILRKKAADGVEIRLIYDDVGCMTSLPGNYRKILRKQGIYALPFSRLRGNADSECNKRNHRKLVVIDGKIGYLGGVNLSDEYINVTQPLGVWKDCALRLQGAGVQELTRLFLTDLALNEIHPATDWQRYFPILPERAENGLVIPFGDGPRPLYARRVGKSVIQALLTRAERYVWISTPYLIIDHDLCTSLENAALRGVDVRIFLPHVPDKPLVFAISRSLYPRLMAAGVKIYEYLPGFLHAKSYLADDDLGLLGSINLDHRSLVHQFECGTWLYRCDCLQALKKDLLATCAASKQISDKDLRVSPLRRAARAFLRLFAPLL